MAITHTWKVRKLVQKNDNTGTVIQVFYKVYSVDGEFECISAGNVDLIVDNISNFVPYQDLTEELVIQWVKEKLGPNLGNHEHSNSDWIIAAQNPIDPTIKVENLPWEVQI